MANMLGYKRNCFKGNDGKMVNGYNVFLGTPIGKDQGHGYSVERFYLSDARIEKMGIDLEALAKSGQALHVSYTRYGKIDSLTPEE